MKIVAVGEPGFQETLERKAAELNGIWRQRDAIAVEKSADQMDQIQYAAERDLAIRNVDRDATLLRETKAALQRLREGTFGFCIECEAPISPKRLAAVPWASRCIDCQGADDRNQQAGGDSTAEALNRAA